MAAAPKQGSRPTAPSPAKTGQSPQRLIAALLAAGCWGGLAAAAWLSPHASGTGTHEELGLPSCGFLARTGLPCPTCGLTTAISAAAHGRIKLAWKAHPLGVFLFVGLAAMALAATVGAVAGKRLLWRRSLWWLAWGALLGIPGAWAIRLILGLADGTLPMR